jgi:hypothetical protein
VTSSIGREPEAGRGELAYAGYQPTPYDVGITDDPDAQWPEPVNGIRLSPEATAAHFGYASVAEMKDAAEAALEAAAEAHEWDDADSAAYHARVEAGLEPEAEL